MANINAKQDGNQTFSLYGISGTLGPTYGTAETRPITVNEQGQLRVESSASLTVGTIAEVTNIAGGTITVTNPSGNQYTEGTTVGTLQSNVQFFRGTGGTLTAVGTASPLPITAIGGTIQNLNAGTITSVANLASGTLLNSGTTTGVGVVTSVTNLVSGTLAQVTSVANLVGGTITALALGSIGGDVASAASDSGNPVKIGGKVNTTPPSFTDGQRADIQVSTRGAMRTTLMINNSTLAVANAADNADANATSSNADKLVTIARGQVYNGASWDRMVGDTQGVYVKGHPKPAATVLAAGASGTTAVGTLVAAGGSGTAHYVTGFSMTVTSGTPEICLSFGTAETGSQVIAKGLFSPGGGMARDLTLASSYGTSNAPLTYKIISGAGTVNWNVNYWTGV